MPGNFVALPVNSIFEWKYNSADWREPPKMNTVFPKDKENTYFIIFGPNQGVEEAAFNKQAKSKLSILFKSRKSVNNNYKNSPPRNTLYVFEVI